MFKVWLAALLTLQYLGLSVAQQRVFGSLPTENGTHKRAITPELSDFVEELMKANDIPGLSLGVVRGDDVELGAWGIKTEDGEETASDTLFAIGSCSKAFLATSVGILMDDFAQGWNVTPLPPNVHTFDWHTPVKDVLPEDWKLMDEWASSRATMRDILSHQSGLPRHDWSYRRTDKPIEVIRRMRHLRPAFELRQQYHYNNQMYMLSHHLVETYSGIPHPQFVKERIWDKLNMSHSTFSDAEATKTGKFTQAWHLGKRRIPFWFDDDTMDLIGGAGGIVTSTEDITKWLKMLLNNGVNPTTNEMVISPVTFEEVTTAHTIVNGRATEPYFSIQGYDIAWTRGSCQGHEVIEHSGGLPGFSAEIFFLPSANLGIVVLANRDETHAQENAIAYRVIEDIFELPYKASEKFAPQSASASCNSDAPASSRNAPLPLPLSTYAGTYHDEGYGTLTLCAPSSSSPHCTRVLAAFAPFENTTNSGTPTLYATIPSFWFSHLRFRHLYNRTFSLTGSVSFPDGYGKDGSAFEVLEDAGRTVTADFVVDRGTVKGFSVRGFVGRETELERRGGSVKDIPEVWFQRLE